MMADEAAGSLPAPTVTWFDTAVFGKGFAIVIRQLLPALTAGPL
jgi:hypothetical protein